VAADLDQLARVGELASGGQLDDPSERDPARKKPAASTPETRCAADK
jgi:hypothetical protein